jgi:hypothetical protein
MKLLEPIRAYSAGEVRDYVNGISGYNVFTQHRGKHATIVQMFLKDHPDGNSSELIQWYKRMSEDVEFQRHLNEAA